MSQNQKESSSTGIARETSLSLSLSYGIGFIQSGAVEPSTNPAQTLGLKVS